MARKSTVTTTHYLFNIIEMAGNEPSVYEFRYVKGYDSVTVLHHMFSSVINEWKLSLGQALRLQTTLVDNGHVRLPKTRVEANLGKRL